VADEKDILDKADALLKRHSATAGGADAGDVPVLTDLVESPAPAAAPAAAPADPLDREVFIRVVADVEKRLASDLERRVAQQLVPHVHEAVSSALDSLHEDIARAVAEALKARHVK
jgi:hypothetical protein